MLIKVDRMNLYLSSRLNCGKDLKCSFHNSSKNTQASNAMSALTTGATDKIWDWQKQNELKTKESNGNLTANPAFKEPKRKQKHIT